MKNTLFKNFSLLKLAAVTSLALAFMACSDNSNNVTFVMYDDDGNEYPVPSDILKSSSSVKKNSSSSSVAATSSSSAKTAASSSSVDRATSSSSAKAVSSSSAKSTASSSSAKLSSSSSEKKLASSSSEKAPASSAASSSSTGSSFFNENWREACLDKINEYRATENLEPLTLAPEEKQTCTDKQAGDDLAENKAHGHFRACEEWAQNSGPNFNTSWRKTATEATDAFLKMMWEDEKALVLRGERDPDKKEDYSYIGHYLNMKGNYKSVACGISLTEDGKKGWLNINFF
ncbi:CAP domain-containing protein [Fibrobacter succinogenes]|uniref:CAP domain-containing protein n=1 Tax=Fibrobacter succinogenes TaxID=833 RepID=UPI0015688B3F|nr:CAP domain-containing protein [Fibrobacter succinogenes]